MGPDSNPAAERGETGGENREGTEHWVLTCNGLPPTATTSGPAHRIKDVQDHGGEEHWVLTRHADVTAALADPRLSITNTNVTLPAKSRTYNTDRYDQTLLDLEPPDHTRLRKLVVRRFSAKEVEALRPRIQQITDEVLSNAASNQADLVDTVALEVPVRVICEVLGIPGDACEEIIRKTDMSVFPPQAPMELVYGTLADLIETRRARPTGDLISELVTAHADGKLTDIELFHFGGMLFFAATKASVHPIRNGTHLILRHPGQLAELRSDPILLPPAVDEMLRHVGPSSAIARYALHDFEVGGVTIPKGSRITLGLTAANHDPDVFAAPDNFDIHRAAGSGLAFGYGIHLCIGARLAKVQTEIVIGALLRRFPERIRDWSAATTHVCQGQVRWMAGSYC